VTEGANKDWKDRLLADIDALRAARDELKVQMHLAKAEARERWEKLEKKWHHLEARGHVLAEASRESLDDIEEAGRLLVQEIREGYDSLRKLL